MALRATAGKGSGCAARSMSLAIADCALAAAGFDKPGPGTTAVAAVLTLVYWRRAWPLTISRPQSADSAIARCTQM